MRKLRQALPSTRMIPNLRVRSDADQASKDARREWENRISDLAGNAYRRKHGPFEQEPLSVILAPSHSQRAAEFYISEKVYDAGLPQLRKILKAGKSLSQKAPWEAVARFCELAGTTSDEFPPFAQMRALFCYGDPSSNGLEENDPDKVRDQLEREGIWESTLSPTVILSESADEETVSRSWSCWFDLIKKIHERTGRGRSPIAAEVKFVGELAHYWRHELQAPLGNSRAQDYHSNEPAQQRGLFADFVRMSAEVIPPEYRPRSWERAIRNVLEQG